MEFITKIFVISKRYVECDNGYKLKYNPAKMVGEHDSMEDAKRLVESIRVFYEDEQGYDVTSYKNGESLKIMQVDGFTEIKIVEL